MLRSQIYDFNFCYFGLSFVVEPDNSLLTATYFITHKMLQKLLFFCLLTNIAFGQYRFEIDLEKPSEFERFNIEHAGITYEKRLNFSEGLILIFVPSKKKFAYMDSHANVIFPTQFDQFTHFKEGLACVRKGKKWGYINPAMELVIPIMYDDANYFLNEKASVRLKNERFLIDKNGKKVVD